MRALKGLVIGMGVLIVVAMGVLAWGVFRTANDPDFTLVGGDTAATAPAAATTAGFGDIPLRLPDGCSIVDMRPDGDRLYLRVGPAGDCERVVVIDVAGGRVLGTVAVRR